MTKIEDFKIDGIELSKEDFKLIESQFRNKFFVNGEKLNWKGEKRPGWTQFLEDKLVVDFNGEIHQQLPKSYSFYVYFEFGRSIYICSFEQDIYILITNLIGLNKISIFSRKKCIGVWLAHTIATLS